MSAWLKAMVIRGASGVIAGRYPWNPNEVFAFNLTAVSLLTVILEFVTKKVSLNLPDALGGLLYAVLGNIAGFIIGIVALRNGQVGIVQSTMLGSILSSLLLFMGICFVGNIVNMRDVLDAEGIQQSFSPITARTTRSLMLSSVLQIRGNDAANLEVNQAITLPSRSISIILLLLYILTPKSLAEDPIISLLPALTLLVVAAYCIAICANHLLDSICHVTHITESFSTFILIPVVINATGHVTAVSVYNFCTLVVILSLTKSGRSNYLKGVMALDMYTVIGLAFYFSPKNIPTKENTKVRIS
ncbi:hypothetical protein BDP55DRAFT_750203 [Colletotrichum godetiae]|uniref:Sodium/calcium exchanger membrane region domain-containing protein n=1 Tax=Colletotrichum godetiae TaxID=1209918 RepID=A0AAJ0AER2_9PEZI|nr:uncharacterized protein BDP55DRAFT_750203 [Colletotrichum godetiae]KAK1672536.1 hypothetical protein BDP55DRAFT_750203 [Colletotrichum godetiae]